MRTASIALLVCLSIGTATGQSTKNVKTLAAWMMGHFSSEAQAKADSAFFNIHLTVTPIWSQRADGFWLYVEQAAAESLDKPYRQRVYHLSEQKGILQSVIYTLPKPLRFARKPALVEALSRDSLSTRVGCEVVIARKNKKTFTGSTVDKNCTSDLRGAAYATTEVTITKDQLLSWDRGYDATGKQVWGAVKSGYVFKRVKEK